ncbi:hypothetical protein F0L68_29505 [Solihabitans fulvus]|uniref:Uncharacterized protein n=1 Tax=Solihabitans fulvus TaxID=1892852 RepID=A0A5B2WYC9_9PSEU|nr:hypothetical protein [Solihabitans fulvus]KAA2254917.1 hypothetical protein F0L68_29505 [Solihabitans fulvus]
MRPSLRFGMLGAAVAAGVLTLSACGPTTQVGGPAVPTISNPAGGSSSTAPPANSPAPPTSGSVTAPPFSPPPRNTLPIPTTEPAPAPPASGPPPNAGPVPPNEVDASGLPAGTPHDVYTENGGRTVGLVVEQSGCREVHGELAGESAGKIQLVLVTVDRSGHGMCPQYVRSVRVSVDLTAPLGERVVVLTVRTDRAN